MMVSLEQYRAAIGGYCDKGMRRKNGGHVEWEVEGGRWAMLLEGLLVLGLE